MPTRKQTLEGLPVIDATEPLYIEVIDSDINQKRRKDPGRCAVAEACKRELHITEARAYASRLYIRQETPEPHWVRYELPETVRQEVAAFDRGGGFSTGFYRITPPRAWNRLGYKKPTGTGGKVGSGRPLRPSHRNVTTHREVSPLAGGAKT